MMHISSNSEIKKILIENNINSKDDIKLFCDELTFSTNDTEFEITFINVSSLPILIIQALYKIVKRAKIITTHRSLFTYLTKLEIHNYYKNDSKEISPIRAIALSGNSNNADKIIEIIKVIPFVNISIFIVIDSVYNMKNYICKFIKKVTSFNICEINNNMKIENNHIYITSESNNILIADGFIYLNKQKKTDLNKESINTLYKSLSYEYKNSLLVILLSECEKNNNNFCTDLKQNNSQVIIEASENSELIDTNKIHIKSHSKVLSISQIQYYINSVLFTNVDIKTEINSFFENIQSTYGYDFRNYHQDYLQRRVETLMIKMKIFNFQSFKQMVLNDEILFEKLLTQISINVTSFFRDTNIFQVIIKKVLPTLGKLPSIRVWCAGCSKGDEPYSIAIMLDKMGLLHKSLIYATDFNETVLKEAENGLFSKNEYEISKVNYTNTYGEKDFNNWFEINENYMHIKQRIKEKVIFFKHNLVTDSSINEFDLIFCRNVLIYFDKCLQENVFDLIDKSLNKNGFLILGENETLQKKYNYLSIKSKKSKIFKKDF